MFDQTSSKTSTGTSSRVLYRLPEPPAVSDAVDRLNFAQITHNTVALPEG